MSGRKVSMRVNERGHRIGESHPNAKLSDADVDLLIADREAGMTLSALALKWGMSKSGVKSIVDGKNRAQIGPTVSGVPARKTRGKKVRVQLTIDLHQRALLHRLGGADWVVNAIKNAQ